MQRRSGQHNKYVSKEPRGENPRPACKMNIARFDQFNSDPVTVARRLLGQKLVRIIGNKRIAGIIVEVEAYLGAIDQAAHTFGGRRTPRNEAMYLAGGHAYVYFTYGMHHCMNIVCGEKDEGVAVLLRAIEPVEGIEQMRFRRPAAKNEFELCSGPARLTKALDIDLKLNSEDLRFSQRLFIERVRNRALPTTKIERGPRVGVGYAGLWATEPLRFWIRNSPHVSRPSRQSAPTATQPGKAGKM